MLNANNEVAASNHVAARLIPIGGRLGTAS